MSSFDPTPADRLEITRETGAALTDFDYRIAASLLKLTQALRWPKDTLSYLVDYLSLNQPPVPISQIIGWGTQISTVTTAEFAAMTPVHGQQVILQVDASTLWLLRYDAESASSYKWTFMGGTPLFEEIAAIESVASTTYVAMATAGPAVTLPRAGDYRVEIGAHLAVGKATSLIRMSYDIGATGAVDADSVESSSTNATNGQIYDYATAARTKIKTGLSAVTLTAKYMSGDTTADVYKARFRYMQVTPIRIS